MRGGLLDENGLGVGSGVGPDIDYVEGWCLCVSRETYREHGLFDEVNLEFAYGEDADLSLRLREAGRRPYALHLDCVFHHGNVTAKEVAKTQSAEMKRSFDANHDFIKRRWGNYLKADRAKIRGPAYEVPFS